MNSVRNRLAIPARDPGETLPSIQEATDVTQWSLRALETFLLQAFSRRELYLLARKFRPDLHNFLPGESEPMAELVADFVLLLERRGDLGHSEFFELLRKERPARHVAIDAIQAGFGVPRMIPLPPLVVPRSKTPLSGYRSKRTSRWTRGLILGPGLMVLSASTPFPALAVPLHLEQVSDEPRELGLALHRAERIIPERPPLPPSPPPPVFDPHQFKQRIRRCVLRYGEENGHCPGLNSYVVLVRAIDGIDPIQFLVKSPGSRHPKTSHCVWRELSTSFTAGGYAPPPEKEWRYEFQ